MSGYKRYEFDNFILDEEEAEDTSSQEEAVAVEELAIPEPPQEPEVSEIVVEPVEIAAPSYSEE